MLSKNFFTPISPRRINKVQIKDVKQKEKQKYIQIDDMYVFNVGK